MENIFRRDAILKYGRIVLLLQVFILGFSACKNKPADKRIKSADKQIKSSDNLFISYTSDPFKDSIAFYWRDDKDSLIRSLGNLQRMLATRQEQLVFAMNGGMYLPDNTPQGLYIENGSLIKEMDTAGKGFGNFHLMPNGTFIIDQYGKASVISSVALLPDYKNIRWATQSGPMLVIDGTLHPAFKKGSPNVHIRNGVGILPDGKILFAISTVPVNLYDFACFFKDRGCKNALYLDGFVSRCYYPEGKILQRDGNFGVMIGITRSR